MMGLIDREVFLYSDLAKLTRNQRSTIYSNFFPELTNNCEPRIFFVELADSPDHVQIYGHLDLKKISIDLELLALDEITSISYFTYETFVREETSKDVDLVEEQGMFQLFRSDAIKSSWINYGTWIEPPLMCEANLVSPDRTGLQLVEGHTRMGCILGLSRKPIVKVAAYHKSYVIRGI